MSRPREIGKQTIAMATSSLSESEVTKLAARNQALSEELSQCQADKEFVWSLWKRLQVSKPDVSQAISMVVQREKEKTEMKDRKVLEILHTKDDRIAELERLLSEHDKRQQRDADRGQVSEEMREEMVVVQNQLVQEKQASEEKMKEYKEKMERLLEEKTKQVEEMAVEKEALKQHCDELQSAIEDSQRELQKMKALSSQYESKIQELQKGLEDVIEKAQLASQEVDKKAESLSKAKNKLQEMSSELKASDHSLHSTRVAYQELKSQHDQSIQQASQQAKLIQQLQALQADTQKVLKNQENAHNMELAQLKKMYDELLTHNEKLVQSNSDLKQRLAGKEPVKPVVRHVSLQANLDKVRGQRSRSQEMEVLRLREEIVSDTRFETRYRGYREHHDEESGTADRATSTPVKQTVRRARSLSPARTQELMFEQDQVHTRPHSEVPVHTRSENQDRVHTRSHSQDWIHARSHSQDRVDKYMHSQGQAHTGRETQGRISDFLDVSQQKGREARKQDDLRRLLRLKNQEVDELRKAHSRRLDRLRSLQSAYDILKEQIKTYEQYESGNEKRKKVPRSSSKELRREDSEGVWNELAHYKQRTINLMQEKMNIDEEVDRLRVQAAVDASTIEDLTKCLEGERKGLESHLVGLQAANKREEREKARAEDLFEKNKKLKKTVESLQAKEAAWLEEKDQMERQLRSMKADLVQTKTTETHHALEHQALLAEVSKLRIKLRGLSRSMKDSDLQEKDSEMSRRELAEDGGEGVHIVLHTGAENTHGEENSPGISSSEDGDRAIFHSTPRKRQTRQSRSLSPTKSSPERDIRSKSRSGSSSKHHSPTRSRTRALSPSQLHMSRSRSFGGTSPSRRELVSVLHHLDRMAQAYQDTPPVFKTLLMSVSTQTERVLYAESGMMTESEESNSATTITTQSTDDDLVPGIHNISPIHGRRDIATSPIKTMNMSNAPVNLNTRKSRGISPGPSNVNLLKKRLGALQQQVSALQDQRKMLQKAALDQKQAAEALQADLNLANARQHNSKITIQRLSRDLEETKKERDALQEEKESLMKEQTKKHSDAAWNSAEARLKSQASEIVRQGSTIKALKAEGEEKNTTIKSLESKIEHLDRDISQKRSLIKDLRARAKSVDTHDKIHAETVETLESQVQSLTETLDQRKVEIDSLRKRVAVVTKEKHHHEQQSLNLQNMLDKKSAVLKDTLSKLSEAERSLSELEDTASQQLHMLASQSEKALDAAHGKIKQLQDRIRDLEMFIQDLALETASQSDTTSADQVLGRGSSKTATAPDPPRSEKDESMLKAQSIASSILNMSTSDLELFMDVEREEEKTRLAKESRMRKAQNSEWRKQIEAALAAKKLPRRHLKELMLKGWGRQDVQSLERGSS